MPFSGIISVDLVPYYANIGDSLGMYIVDQGEEPMIVLNTSLKGKNDPNRQIVYQALVGFHKDLPDIYRLFPLEVCYEDLPPPVQALAEPEIIVLGRYHPPRCFTCGQPDLTKYRVIGG